MLSYLAPGLETLPNDVLHDSMHQGVLDEFFYGGGITLCQLLYFHMINKYIICS